MDKKDSLSIQGQIDLCRKEAQGEVTVYQDKGFSGKNTNRPDFQRMMADVEKGLVQRVIVYRLDRFSRSLADFSQLWEVLGRHGVEFISVNEKFDTSTPVGRAMLSIIMVFAQLERETTAERVRDNYYQRAKLGSWPGGPAPYGFSLGRLPDATGKLSPGLIPNDHMETVEEIFRRYAQDGESLGSIAKELNAKGIAAPKRATWDNVTLSRILHSPLYVMADEDVYLYYQGKGLQFGNGLDDFDGCHAGMIVGKRDKNAGKYRDLAGQHFSLATHAGVIPSELWLRCQYKLDANRQLGGNGRGKHTWLSGLLKCGKCGYSVKVMKDGDKYYLVCSGRSNLGVCDQSIRVELPTLEREVQRELERLLEECPDVDTRDMEDQEAARQLAAIEQKIDRLMAALAESDDVTMPYVNRTIRRLEQEQQELLQAREKERTKPRLSTRRIDFATLDFEQKKLVASQFIQTVRLSKETAEVEWRV